MKILVTGGCGFIGSNFINKITNRPLANILNIDSLTYASSPSNINTVDNYSFIHGSIADNDLISKTLDSFRPNYIVNFAAESHVDRSIDNADSFINTNVIGTYVLLNESLKYYKNIKPDLFKFIHISTDEVFGDLSIYDDSFNEDSNYRPNSPYSASKASSDHFVRAWNKTYNFPSIILNSSNNYGPFQFPEKLVPLMIIKALAGEKLPIYGNGKQIRDWIHVDDHCDAIIRVMEDGQPGDRYNIGGQSEFMNIDLVNLICDTLDKILPSDSPYSSLIEFVKDRPGHDMRYSVDINNIKNKLGWEPKITFSNGIVDTIHWYLDNRDWWEGIINNQYNLKRLGSND